MRLLERDRELAALDDELSRVKQDERGRMVLIGGEAGVGKTALCNAFCESAQARARVLRGWCEPLQTPRAAGPLLDIAEQTGGRLAAQIATGAQPPELLPTLLQELRRRRPTIVLLEDLHWADGSTLDTLRLLSGRLAQCPALILATFRDELGREHPLRITLGELNRTDVRRLTLTALSTAAIEELSGLPSDVASAIHATTGGNPFFVTELLSTPGETLPESVRDAVLARAARLSVGARRLLDTVTVVPAQIELWLLRDLAGSDLANLEECVAAGMLVQRGADVGFRHEIAREALLAVLPGDRALALHARALATLELVSPPPAPARLAHHAAAIGDAAAVVRHAPTAGDHAAAVGAHREAAAHYADALRFGDAMPELLRCTLYEKRAYECYLTEQIAAAIEARREALMCHRAAGRKLEEGDSNRWLSRLAWFNGDNAGAQAHGIAAVELLAELPPGREYAMALSNMSQLRMLAADVDGARHWGARAIELASQLGDGETLVHALNNVGTAEFDAGDPAGEPKLRKSLELALAAGMHEHAARAYTNLGCQHFNARRYAEADAAFAEGIAYCRDRDLGSWVTYMQSWQARSALEQGDFMAAERAAKAVIDRSPSPPSLISALVVIALLRGRRGDPDPWSPLERARTLAAGTGEPQRLEPVASARSELRWLTGQTDDIALEPEAEGGRPYEAALTRLRSRDPATMKRAHEELVALGATAAARRAADTLRRLGVTGVRRGPRPATRANAAALTPRELEVVQLLSQGLRNGEIAARLVLSERTVAHHVSAVMAKLDARSRTEAVAKAAALDVLPR